MRQCFLNVVNFPSVFLTWSILAVDPISRNITVSTQLHGRSLFTKLDGFVRGPHCYWYFVFSCFFFFVPVLVQCIVEWLTLCNAKVTNLFLSSIVWHLALLQVQSSLPALLSPPCPRRTHGYASPTCVSTVWCTGLFSFQLPSWTAAILCFSI